MNECIVFQIKDSKEALEHIIKNFEEVILHNESGHNYPLYNWDDGHRKLMKCNKCDALILFQSSDFHSFYEKDLFHQSYFPISDMKELENINKKYSCAKLEKEFSKKWIMVKNSKCYWINIK